MGDSEPFLVIALMILSLIVGALLAALQGRIYRIGTIRLKAIHEARGRYAAIAERLLQRASSIHASMLAGRALCLSVAVLVAVCLVQRLHGLTIALAGAALVACVYGMLVTALGALLVSYSDHAILSVYRFARPLLWFLAPIALPLTLFEKGVRWFIPSRMAEENRRDSERIQAIEVDHIIEQSTENGVLDAEHARLLRSLREFRDTVAHEVMVPRTKMVAIEVDTPVQEVLKLVIDKGHSRYPIYRERLDEIEGLLYAKDFLQVISESNGEVPQHLARLMRKPVFFTTENKKIGVLLREMQARRVHMAVVVDEFGGTSGVVTLEDILEEIVGDIRDEHDIEESLVRETGPGRYLANAGMSIYDLQDYLGVSMASIDGAEYDSLGGMLIELAGKVPTAGESLRAGEFEFIVRDADERQVRRVEIIRCVESTPVAEHA